MIVCCVSFQMPNRPKTDETSACRKNALSTGREIEVSIGSESSVFVVWIQSDNGFKMFNALTRGPSRCLRANY